MTVRAVVSNNHLNGLLHAALTGTEVRYLDNGYLLADYTPHADPMYRKIAEDAEPYWAPVPAYATNAVECALLQLRYMNDPTAYRFALHNWDMLWGAAIIELDRMGKVVHRYYAEAKTPERATALAVYKHLIGDE